MAHAFEGHQPDLSQLSAWAPELARTFVALASDIALVIDDDGVIRTVEQGEAQPIAPGAFSWVGQPWIDTVSGDTRAKIEKLLEEAGRQGVARRREVNHNLKPGVSLPVAYTAIRLGENGPVLAVGRDMRAIAAIQQRFIESQQDMERSYWHSRQAESRHQLLHQVATDAFIVADADTLSILDANPAALELLSAVGETLVGKSITAGFAHASRGAVTELLAAARASGQSGEIRVRLLGTFGGAGVMATSFRGDDGMRLLVRVRAVEAEGGTGHPVPSIGKGVADAVVVTDSSGRILLADRAFLTLLQLDSEGDARSRPLIDWLDRSELPLESLVAAVRRRGIVPRFEARTCRPGVGPQPVSVSAVLLTEGDQERIGFAFRRSAFGLSTSDPLPQTLQDAMQALAAQVGQLPMSALMREATTLAEHHFVQSALLKTEGDRAAAALLLGIDRARLEIAALPCTGARSPSEQRGD